MVNFQLNNTSSKSLNLSRTVINFNGMRVLCLVVLAHMAALWLWLADAPSVARITPAAPLIHITQAAIVKEPLAAVKPKAQKGQKQVASQGTSETPQTPQTLQAPQMLPLFQAPSARPASPSLSTQSPQSSAPSPTNKAAALEVPASIQLHYTLTKGNSSAEAVLTWRPQLGNAEQLATYELTLEVTAGFLTPLKQTSTGHVTSLGLVPIRYADKRLRKPEQATHFDAAVGVVTFSNNRPQTAWQPGSQDRLSVLVQLAAIVKSRLAVQSQANSEGFRAGDFIELPVASTDELELWQWEVQPAADFGEGGLKLVRRPRRAYDAQIELWLSPALGYLPARIRQTDSSGVTDQVLTRAL
jgi:hypothetical protein